MNDMEIAQLRRSVVPAPVESKRVVLHYHGTLDGNWNNDGRTDIGPVLVEVHEVEYVEHRASYFVVLNGVHQCGGFLCHGYSRILAELRAVRFGSYGRGF